MSESTEAIITLSGRNIPYHIVRSRRAKRLRLAVSDAGVSVTLPVGVKISEAEKMLQQHGEWVLAMLERVGQRKAKARSLPSDVILLRGEIKQIQVIEELERLARVRVEESADRLALYVPAGSGKDGRAMALPWLKAMARSAIETSVRKQAGRLGVSYRRITIRDQKTRWGSCSTSGTLSFNWRLIMAPPWVLEYVVVHELAHLKQANHSAAFWQVVAGVYPEYKQARDWLRKNSSLLRPVLNR